MAKGEIKGRGTIPPRFYDQVIDLITRVRMVEENLENVMRRIMSFEISFVKEMKEIRKTLQEIRSKISTLESEINVVKNELQIMEKRLEDFAKKEDIRVLEKYIEFLNPSAYVTEKRVKEIIKELLGGKDVFWEKEKERGGRV